MSQHPCRRSGVSETPKKLPVGPTPLRGGREKVLPAWIRGQDTRLESPDHFLALAECRRLRDAGVGQFINQGRGFRRWDTAQSKDGREYQRSRRSRRRGESLKIDKPMMDRYVAGEEYAVAAVEGWGTMNDLFPYVLRVDMYGHKKGERCRLLAFRGYIVPVKFEDGREHVMPGAIIRRAAEFKNSSDLPPIGKPAQAGTSVRKGGRGESPEPLSGQMPG